MENINLYPRAALEDFYAAMEEMKSEDIEISTEIRGEIKLEHSTECLYEKKETQLMIEKHEVIEPDSDSDIKIDFHAVVDSVKYEESKIRDDEIEPIHIAPSVLSDTREIPKSDPSLPDEKWWPTLCRLCAIPCDDMIHIFGPTILHKSIIEKIQDCLPITVKVTDTLSKKVCRSCLQKLESYHEFHMTVIEAEKQLLVFHEQTKDGPGEGMRIHRRNSDVNVNNNELNVLSNLHKDNETRNSSWQNHNTELSTENSNFGETAASQSEQGDCFAALNSPICEVYVEEESKFDKGVSDTVNHTPPNTTGQSVARLETDPLSTEQCSYFLRKRKSIKYNSDNDGGLSCNEVIDGHAPAAQNVERQLIKCNFCKAAVQTIEKCHSHARIHASTNYYPCGFCDKILETESKWRDHWSKHIVIRESRDLKRIALLYSCNECEKKFASKVSLQYHKLYHERSNSHRQTRDKVLDAETVPQQRVMGVHNRHETSTGNVSGIQFRNNEESNAQRTENAFQCICCKKKLASNVMLEKHKKICFDITKKYTCDHCKKVFESISTLRIHMPIHTRKQNFSCDFCPKSFSRKGLRDEHHNVHTGNRPFSCDICPKSFKSKGNRNEHRRIHTAEGSFNCDICPKSFTNERSRDEHRRVHTGERPFSCDICLKSFTTKKYRNEHCRIHTGERPFSCDICPQSFTKKQNRDVHRRIHTGERPFSCDICPKSFRMRQFRDNHRRTHTGERPFMCSICGNTYSSDTTLNGHMKYFHSNERRYPCSLCDKSFKRVAGRNQHVAGHAGNKYKCDLCEIQFSWKTDLYKHKITCHKKLG